MKTTIIIEQEIRLIIFISKKKFWEILIDDILTTLSLC